MGVPSFWITWQPAALIALVLGVGAFVLLRSGRRPARVAGGFAREAAIVFGLFSLWQRAAELSITRVKGAVAHADWVWRLERALHLPNEVAMQRAVLPHPSVVKFSNLYYAGLHFPVTIAFLIWLYARHRNTYARVRNTIAVATGACLLVQMIPVAPPRMMPRLGFVDTGLRYGQSVYGSLGRGIADQLSAMPSVHVAWAVLVAITVVVVSASRWRWLAVVHAVLTSVVVVVTANHFWLDGIVATALLGFGWAVAVVAPAALARLRRGSIDGTAEPEVIGGVAERPVRVAAEHPERPVCVGDDLRERPVVRLRPVGAPLEPLHPERAGERGHEVARVAAGVARVVERDGRHLEMYVRKGGELEQGAGRGVRGPTGQVGEPAVVERDTGMGEAFEQSG